MGTVAAFIPRPRAALAARGYAATDVLVRMTRADIGNYLGLKLETVSRLFSKFQQAGWIEVGKSTSACSSPRR